ncbi:MAG: NADPH-dependent glutamate synthase [Dehalococcoidia bacterium]|nr:NADPH-dependent glutamate synthase [Dehalococcoidia bacterium]
MEADTVAKKELNLNRVEMPRQDPAVRARNFEEVALGYSQANAIAEANRCLQCPRPTCKEGCPVNVQIPEFIKALREGDMEASVAALKLKNSLPSVCGRVCPQEEQCEKACVLNRQGAPVAIGRLERYVADWALNHPAASSTTATAKTGRKVAVVGAGPSGLTCAADLAKVGHSVTLFEALHTAGGVLKYGIPEFRLPKKIVQSEVDYVLSLGVELVLDNVVGRTETVDELFSEGFEAIFLAPGAGAPMFLNIPGENLNNVYSANEFLTRVNLMKAYRFPEMDTPIRAGNRVAVFGGGNVAMDASRCALRLGAKEVYIVYRRSEHEMPARAEERENAKEEGVIFKLLTNPRRFIGDEKSNVRAVECYEMELGEPDASGRRRPIAKLDSAFELEIDTAIIALGTRPNPVIPTTTPGLELTPEGTIKTDPKTGRTSREGVWCGGDMATGAATVISAMGAGKRAAADIDAYLRARSPSSR